MNTKSAVPTGREGARRALLPLLLAAAFLVVTITAYGGFVSASTGGQSFDNVQVSVLTSNGAPGYSYTVSAYNTTGGLVASYESQYPAAAFELPSGNYVFAATATQQQSGYYYGVASSGTAVAPTSSGPASSSGAAGSTAIICCAPGVKTVSTAIPCCINNYPASEYGYASQQVSGPSSFTISTKPLNQTSAATLTIQVRYPNGTAASGVYLSASVLGDVYGWAYGTGDISLSSTTNSQGTATLVAPAVPILVNADASVPVVLPFNQTTVQVTVAGEKVNVTAVWEPSYLSFAGQALILPPQNSASIVLHYQQQLVGPIYMGSATESVTGVATPLSAGVTTSVATGSPAQSSTLGQKTSQPESTAGSQTAPAASSSASGTGILLLSVAAVSISVAALGIALFVTRARSTVGMAR